MDISSRCNLLVGVTGSIYATSIHWYIDLFKSSLKCDIKIILTTNAADLLVRNGISIESLEIHTGDRVFVNLWDTSDSIDKVAHVQLSSWADLFVVIPATAGIIAKAANGIADDLLSTTILTYPRPIVFAPAMNQLMWNKPAFQRNKKRLEEDGHRVIQVVPTVEIATGQNEGYAPSTDDLLLQMASLLMSRFKHQAL